jgi:hypothetical protein
VATVPELSCWVLGWICAGCLPLQLPDCIYCPLFLVWSSAILGERVLLSVTAARHRCCAMSCPVDPWVACCWCVQNA